MLAAAGEQPVSTLINNEINDTDTAQQVLNEVIIETLLDGWGFNTVVKTLTPDTSGNIAVSPNYLRVDGSGMDARRGLRVQSNNLYDLDEDTNVFTKGVVVTVVQNMDFDDLPQAFAFFVARQAAAVYYEDNGGDSQIIQLLERRALRAWERCKKDNAKTTDHNWIHNSQSITSLGASRRTRYGSSNIHPNAPI